MTPDQAKIIVLKVIQEALENKEEAYADMQLIGGDSLLDSMKLVQICIDLEDIAEDHGFEFDWASEKAMSKSSSMFRTVTSLANEFCNQYGSGT